MAPTDEQGQYPTGQKNIQHMLRTGDNVHHIPIVQPWQHFRLVLRLQTFQHSNGGDVYVSRNESDANALDLSQVLELQDEPVTFFLSRPNASAPEATGS
jgi:hypothetical protein